MTFKVPVIASRKNSSGINEGYLASLRHGRFANKQIVTDEVKIAMEGMFIWMQNHFQNPMHNHATSGIAFCLGNYAATVCEKDGNFLLDSTSARCRQAFVTNLQNSRSFVIKYAGEIANVNGSTQLSLVLRKKQPNRARLMKFAFVSANPVKKVNTTGLSLFTPEAAKELSVHRDPLHLCRKRQIFDQRAIISSPRETYFG